MNILKKKLVVYFDKNYNISILLAFTVSFQLSLNMKVKVNLMLENQNLYPVMMNISTDDNHIIDFRKLNNDVIVYQDYFFDFNYVIIDKENHIKCTIKNDSINRTFIFQDTGKCLSFLLYLSKNNLIFPEDSFSFIIRNKNFKNKIKPQRYNNDYEFVEKELPFQEFIEITKQDILNSSLSSFHFSLLNLNLNSYRDFYDKLLLIEDTDNPLEDYISTKKQWQLTTYSEWDHNHRFRIFVYELEKWIDLSNFKLHEHKQMFFDIAVSLFMDSLGELKFLDNFICFLKILFIIYIRENNDNSFLDPNGKIILCDEAESIVFWRMKALWKIIIKSNSSVLDDSLIIREILADNFPSTFDLLNERGIISLSFAKKEADFLFIRGRTIQDSLMIFSSAVCSCDLLKYKQYLIATSFVLLKDKLQEIPKDDKKLFKKCYLQEIRNINTRILIYNVEKFLASIIHL